MKSFLAILAIVYLYAIGGMGSASSTSQLVSEREIAPETVTVSEEDSLLHYRHEELLPTLNGLVTRFKGEEFTNSKVRLAWHHTYLIRGLVVWQDLYPGDSLMIDSLLHYWLRELIDSQDYKIGRKDFMDRSMYGWSCAQYSDNGENCRFLLHAGLIGSAMLEATSRLLPSDPLRQEVLSEIGGMIEFYEAEWYVSERARYEYPDGFPESRIYKYAGIPINHEAIWIDCLYRYQQLTDCDICQIPVSRFIKHLEEQAAVKWTYLWTVSGHTNFDKPEDVRHGGLILRLVDLLGWEKFPRFTRSAQAGAEYLNKVYLEQGVLSHRVGEFLEGSCYDYIALIHGWRSLPDTKELLQPLIDHGYRECLQSVDRKDAQSFLAQLTMLVYND